ncbi:hypothetical protein KIPB_013568, partial [Kipferlia bialata]|eukprot:g13568.t1
MARAKRSPYERRHLWRSLHYEQFQGLFV